MIWLQILPIHREAGAGEWFSQLETRARIDIPGIEEFRGSLDAFACPHWAAAGTWHWVWFDVVRFDVVRT
jgi:hypothetical protein